MEGVCCAADHTCMETSMICCTQAGGTFPGGTFSPGSTCGQTGACRQGNNCVQTTMGCCPSGWQFDAGNDCDACRIRPSQQRVPADWDSDNPMVRLKANQKLHGLAVEGESVSPAPPARVGRGDHAGSDSSVRTGGSISIFIDSGVLKIIGTNKVDSIRLALKDGDPSMLEIYSPVGGTVPISTQNMGDFSSILVEGGDGDDVIGVDGRFGNIAAAKPLTLDAGNGQDILIGGTGNNTVPEVISMMNVLNNARALTARVDNLLALVGAVDPLGAGTDDLLSKTIDLLERVEADFVLPAADFVSEARDKLITPLTEKVIETRDGIMNQAGLLLIEAKENLADGAQTLLVDAKVELKEGAEHLASQANALYIDTQLLRSDATQMLLPPPDGASDLTEQLDLLAAQLDALVLICETKDPQFPPPIFSFPDPRDVCPEIEELVICMEQHVLDYEALADGKESEGDILEGRGEILSEPDLECLGDRDFLPACNDYETRGELFENSAHDFVKLKADLLVSSAEGYANSLESLFSGAGAMLFNGQTGTMDQFEGAAANFQSDVGADIGGKIAQVEAEIEDLMTDLKTLTDQALAILQGGAREARPRASTCNINPTNTINGGPDANFLMGTLGDDEINGNGGSDLIIGGAGNDRLNGNDGFDLIFGGSGTNEINGGEGVDILVGWTGMDCIHGNDGLDLILGMDDNDVLNGDNYIDVIIGNQGDDMIQGGQGIDLLIGDLSFPPFNESGMDTIQGDNCIDVILGGNGTDILVGGPGQKVNIGDNFSIEVGNVILGGAGADTMYGENNPATGENGIDVLIGGPDSGNDVMHGGNGGEIKIGDFSLKLGNVILGGGGNDLITGKDGIDVLFGGDGCDTISAGKGSELVLFNDTFRLKLGDLIFGDGEGDCLHGDGESSTLQPCMGLPCSASCTALSPASDDQDLDVIFGGGGGDRIFGYDGGDLTIQNFTLKIGNATFGGAGDDCIVCEAGIDFSFGGDDNDTIECGVGDIIENEAGTFKIDVGDFIFGMSGNDILHGDQPTPPSPHVNDGIDLIIGDVGMDRIYGGGGGLIEFTNVDVKFTWGNFIFGGPDDNILIGDYENLGSERELAIDFIVGGNQKDTIHGSDGSFIEITPNGFGVIVFFGNLMFGRGDDDIIDGADRTGGTIPQIVRDLLDPTTSSIVTFVEDALLALGVEQSKVDMILMELKMGMDDVLSGPISLGGVFGGMDLVFAGGGNDIIRTYNGIDLAFGGDGDDPPNPNASAGRVFDLGQGGLFFIVYNNVPIPFPLGNLGFGNMDNDTITSAGRPWEIDLLFGGDGCDTIYAGEGGFIDLAFGNSGADVIKNLPSSNQLKFIIADLFFGGPGPDDIDADGTVLNLVFGGAAADTIRGGTALADILFGNEGLDTIYGGGGLLDLIFGNRGPDVIYGEGGALDVIFGGSVQGGAGDIIYGGDGLNIIFAGRGDDAVVGGPDTDIIFGGAGADLIDTGGGTNLAFGNAGPDKVIGGDDPGGLDLLFGNLGRDTLLGQAGVDLIFGGALLGNPLTEGDLIDGGSGVDLLFGGLGPDKIIGGPFVDVALGGANHDCIYGGDGLDVIFGSRNDDCPPGHVCLGGFCVGAIPGLSCTSGSGKWDVLTGDGGNDFVFGNTGNDMVAGGAGRDLIMGDPIFLECPTGLCKDRVVSGGGGGYSFGNRQDDKVYAGVDNDGATDWLFGNGGDDGLSGCPSPRDLKFGGLGNDTKDNNCTNKSDWPINHDCGANTPGDVCAPAPDGMSCNPTNCSQPGYQCLPSAIAPALACSISGLPCTTNDDCKCDEFCGMKDRIVECDCMPPDECHVAHPTGQTPMCVDNCPTGDCVMTQVNGQTRCDCPPATGCVPTPDEMGCLPFNCTQPGYVCEPIRIEYYGICRGGPYDGHKCKDVTDCVGTYCDFMFWRVLECDCQPDTECHVDLPPPLPPPMAETPCPDDCDTGLCVWQAVGSEYRCDCPPRCRPTPDQMGCEPVTCPQMNEQCVPVLLEYLGECSGPCMSNADCPGSACTCVAGVCTGASGWLVLDCDCTCDDECHVDFPPPTPPPPAGLPCMDACAAGTCFWATNGNEYHCDCPSTSPANDDCVDAVSVFVGGLAATTSGATNDGTASCGNSNGSPDVWYEFVPFSTGTLTVDTCADACFDTVVSVWTGCPGFGGTELACNDDACVQPRSRVSMPVFVGTDYRIRVSGNNGESGSFVLTLQLSQPSKSSETDLVTERPSRSLSHVARNGDFVGRGTLGGWASGFHWPGGNGMNLDVWALNVGDIAGGPVLFGGGRFTMANGVSANLVAKWNGVNWSALGSGLTDTNPAPYVFALNVYDDGGGPDLYAGGVFTAAGGVSASNIAQWNGSTWSPLGSGTNGQVNALTVFDDGGGPALYVGGGFFMVGGVSANIIAKWNGANWSALGSGLNGNYVWALTAFDNGSGPALYVGRDFDMAGGQATNYIAKWDGTNWSSLGSGMDGQVRALTVFDDGGGPALYAGGHFTTAGGVSAINIAKWSGLTWSPLGSGTDPGGQVFALTVFDDGGGAALYAGGFFGTIGGVNTIGIGKWDGSTWSALGSGMNGGVLTLAVFNDGGSGSPEALYAGGQFTMAGGIPSSRIAKWLGNLCTNDSQCDDQLVCNGEEMCVGGACQPGTPVNCNDGIPCTTDACDEPTDSCTATPNHALCSDGLFCNGMEACNASVGCQPGTNPCAPSQTCNEATDTCEGEAACEPLPDGSACAPFTCPNPSDTCLPQEVVYFPTTGLAIVTRCDCVNVDQCYLEIPNATARSVPVICQGVVCPGTGADCELLAYPNPDHSITYRCCFGLPGVCEPQPSGLACAAVVCDAQNDQCVPTVYGYDPFKDEFTILNCDCMDAGACHVTLLAGVPACVGGCPSKCPGRACILIPDDSDSDDIADTFSCDCRFPCSNDRDCNDRQACTCDRCINGGCDHRPNPFGNADCRGITELGDILCILDGYADATACPNGDIAPDCIGDDQPLIELADVLAVLDAYSGQNLCVCPP